MICGNMTLKFVPYIENFSSLVCDRWRTTLTGRTLTGCAGLCAPGKTWTRISCSSPTKTPSKSGASSTSCPRTATRRSSSRRRWAASGVSVSLSWMDSRALVLALDESPRVVREEEVPNFLFCYQCWKISSFDKHRWPQEVCQSTHVGLFCLLWMLRDTHSNYCFKR